MKFPSVIVFVSLGLALLGLGLFGAGPTSAAAPTLGPRVPGGLPGGRLHESTSLNWSGYAVPASNNSVTDVRASWTVPALTCGLRNGWSSIWVGIDGYNSNSVEQIGTEQNCIGAIPRYYAWYEIYPNPSIRIFNLPVKAGYSAHADVSYSGGKFTLTLTVQGQSFATVQSVPFAARSSAEWVVEAPSSSTRILPLANFGTESITNAQATIGGTTGGIGSFSGYDAMTMVTTRGVPKAVPSGLSNGGQDFSVTWHHR